jgi:uncharacterized protein YwqG
VNSRLDELVRRTHPTGFSFAPCAVALTEVLDLLHPWDRRTVGAGIELTAEEEESYASVITELTGVEQDAQYHHLLGHPQLIQDDMRGECELVAHGVDPSPTGYASGLAKQLLAGAAAKWELLLQVDSDEEGLGWMWGDMGRLYFWIRRSDLAARAFDKTWLVLQCG